MSRCSDPALGNGAWTLALQRPFELRWAAGSFEAGAGEAALAAPRAPARPHVRRAAVLAWEPVRWRQRRVAHRGQADRPAAGLDRTRGRRRSSPAPRCRATWCSTRSGTRSLGATPRLRAVAGAQQRRRHGAGGNARRHLRARAAGVRDARLSLTARARRSRCCCGGTASAAARREGRLATRLARGGGAGWYWPDSAPLAGALQRAAAAHRRLVAARAAGLALARIARRQSPIAGTKGDPQLSRHARRGRPGLAFGRRRHRAAGRAAARAPGRPARGDRRIPAARPPAATAAR